MNKIDKQKKERAALRMSFTKTLNTVKSELVKTEIDKGVVIDTTTKLDELMNKIKVLDDSIVDLTSELVESTEKTIYALIEDNEKYLDEYIAVKRKVFECVDSSSQNSSRQSEPVGTINQTKHYKLPKLSIKPYDGSLINYLSFWSQFKKIHEDGELEDCDKFQYLLQSVQSGTRARELLESYPLTSENYAKAVNAFKERFGREDVLTEVYVREFLKLIIANVRGSSKDRLPLPDLFMKVEAYLRSLESMGLNIENNSAWLYPMVESSLPEDVLKAWQRYSVLGGDEENLSTQSNLKLLMKFLKKEVEGEERLQLARSGFEATPVRENYKDKGRRRDTRVPTATSLLTGKEVSCLFCNKSHESKDCFSARALSLKERVAKIKDKNCCLKCLRFGHRQNVCRIFVKCLVCSKSHFELLCPEIVNQKEKVRTATENLQATTAGQVCTAEVALMTLQVRVAGGRSMRALLDCGSQKSYILKSTAQELGFPVISKETIAHTLFGGSRIDPKLHNKYRIKLCSLDRRKASEVEFDFLDQETICGYIPRVTKGLLLRELNRHKIWLSDVGSDSPKIEMLIGSDAYGKILTGQVKQLRGGLTAIDTKLGWTVCGRFEDFRGENDNNTSVLCSLAVRDFNIPDLWSLETIGIADPRSGFTKVAEEEFAREHFLSSLSKSDNGRYCVGLPWVENNFELPSNRHAAEKRLFNVTKRLKSVNKYAEYDTVFKEWFQEGVIEVVPNEELEIQGHYLPHHPVFKPDSETTKIRPVFDASCKTNKSLSLNDCLMRGPNLIEEIPSILLRFREKRIGVTSDIRRAFLQIELKEEDRNYLRFLWWEKNDVIRTYRHARVVFGITSSPWLLGAVISFHLSNVPLEQSSIAQRLNKSFYIDNCVTSVDNEVELKDFIRNSVEILAQAKMDLRMWKFGPVEKGEDVVVDDSSSDSTSKEPITVLGIVWDRENDCLAIHVKHVPIADNLSKREIFSLTQGIFDPLGFFAPVLLPAKLLIQEIWATKSDWDSPLAEEIQVKFKKWYNELQAMSELKLPRRIGFGDKNFWSLHVFCDASQQSYASVIFLRCEEEYEIHVRFVMAKTRVAPLKRMTIPRLELMACVLGSRLSKYVVEAMSLGEIQTYYWTDSTTALSWIKKNDQWGTFVGNRVKEICSLTDPSQWLHVSGPLNPADLPSRGCSPRHIVNSAWWEGPHWLKGPRDSWPNLEINPDEEVVKSERKKSAILVASVEVNEPKWYERFSKFSRIVRILAWVYRFIKNSQKREINKDKLLSASEVQESIHTLCFFVQRESFPDTTDSMNGLRVIRDQSGLIRVKTNIVERDDQYAFRYPILLPSKHYLVNLLILEYHLNNSHAGIQTVMSMIRDQYWIIASRRTIRTVLNKCVRCKRFKAKAPSTAPIQLPLDRVREAGVFEVTGIDLCGPLILRNKSKTWVVLFTCGVYRAVHLELVTAISTENFLLALRRFIARRGRPSVIYSDNGTNFVGTSAALKKVNWEIIVAHQGLTPIKWKFIPPTAAWWGGWWERLIRTTKELLVRVLGRASVTYEELLTIICDIEAVINNRPLTYVSNDSEELSPLTPSMFLHCSKEFGTPDLDALDRDKLLKRQRFCKELREQLRSRFRKEYLGQLVQKAAYDDFTIKVGDVVLMGSENQKRQNWPIAKVEELCPSRDGRVRVVKVKTANGCVIRPVRKLYPLELSSSAKDSVPDVLQDFDLPLTKSKGGRMLRHDKIKGKKRGTCF